MKTRMLAVLVSAVVISGCRQRLVESMDQPVHIGLEELELVDQTVLTGQDEIDFLRAKAERDLETVLAIDPDHPGAEQIRRALADLDWRERQLHWRIANGFEGPDAVYTQEEFWRRMIEDRDLLELTDDAVRAIRARLDVLMRTDTTIAASGSGTDVVCTADAYLDWDASGDLYFDQSRDLLTFSTLSRQYTEMHVAGLGRVGTPQRHRFNGLAEPDARSSNGNLVTYVPPVWRQRDCLTGMSVVQNFVYTGAVPGATYCAGGPRVNQFAEVEKWSQVHTWDFSNWTNHDARITVIEEDCVTVPGGGGGGDDDEEDPRPSRDCTWVSGPGYGFWLCVDG